MVAIAFVLFSACCTLLSAISVIFFGVSVSYIVKLYFLYLTLTAVMVIAIPGFIFLFDRIQKGSRACFPSPRLLVIATDRLQRRARLHKRRTNSL
jgi:hypothetical protein